MDERRFLEHAFERLQIDPVTDGVQIVNAHRLPDPLPLHLGTIITGMGPDAAPAEVARRLSRVLPPDWRLTVLEGLGDDHERVVEIELAALAEVRPGPTTALFVAPVAVGWHGLVTTNRRLREECPWDSQQTHHTLLSHLVEEAYEAVDAITRLPPDAPGGEGDPLAYGVLEEELGDLLLQIVFQSTLAREAGAFDVDEVAEGIRRKLVRRHPHVFGTVEVSGAEEVLANWEALKASEKRRGSLMDDIPTALPAMPRAEKVQRRAASVGFDWAEIAPVIQKVDEELAEVVAARTDPERRTEELGDLLFAVVNLARHLDVDPEIALRQAVDRFAIRFRAVEELSKKQGRDLADMSLEEMDELWEQAKMAQDPGEEVPGSSGP